MSLTWWGWCLGIEQPFKRWSAFRRLKQWWTNSLGLKSRHLLKWWPDSRQFKQFLLGGPLMCILPVMHAPNLNWSKEGFITLVTMLLPPLLDVAVVGASGRAEAVLWLLLTAIGWQTGCKVVLWPPIVLASTKLNWLSLSTWYVPSHKNRASFLC